CPSSHRDGSHRAVRRTGTYPPARRCARRRPQCSTVEDCHTRCWTASRSGCPRSRRSRSLRCDHRSPTPAHRVTDPDGELAEANIRAPPLPTMTVCVRGPSVVVEAVTPGVVVVVVAAPGVVVVVAPDGSVYAAGSTPRAGQIGNFDAAANGIVKQNVLPRPGVVSTQ